MRALIYTGRVIRTKDPQQLELYLKAKEMIEHNGIDDYVLEMSQPHCMGGETLILTSKKELDKEYIGYRGYLDYHKLCKAIEHLRENANQH